MITCHPPSRRSGVAAAALVVFAGVSCAVALPGVAHADVCAGANGRHVYASGCVDVAGAIDYYAPPPAYYAPLPEDFAPPPPPPPLPNVTACVGATGRRGHVTVSGCT